MRGGALHLHRNCTCLVSCTCSILGGLRGVQKDRTDHTKLFPRSFTESGHGKCWKVHFSSFSGFPGHRISSKWVSDSTFLPPSSRTQASIFVTYIFQQPIEKQTINEKETERRGSIPSGWKPGSRLRQPPGGFIFPENDPPPKKQNVSQKDRKLYCLWKWLLC